MEKAKTERVQRNGHWNTCWLPLYGPTFLLPGNSGSLQRLFSRTSPWERGEEGGKKKRGGNKQTKKDIPPPPPTPAHRVCLPGPWSSVSLRTGGVGGEVTRWSQCLLDRRERCGSGLIYCWVWPRPGWAREEKERGVPGTELTPTQGSRLKESLVQTLLHGGCGTGDTEHPCCSHSAFLRALTS